MILKFLNKIKTKGLFWVLKRIIDIFEYRLLGIKRQESNAIAYFCKGDCIEVGAFSNPAILPNADSIEYADIYTSDEAKSLQKNLGFPKSCKNKLVDITIKFDKNNLPLKNVESESKDCIFSSHSLEHNPNPIATLVDYLRVLKPGGIVYSIIPNKNFSFDHKRKATKVSYLIERYRSQMWTYTIDEFRDVFYNSDTPTYFNKKEEDILKAYIENNGTHHIFVYDPSNIIQIIDFLTKNFNCILVHFDISNKYDIHFAIKKV